MVSYIRREDLAMIENGIKVWVVNKGSIVETPKVKAGTILRTLSTTEYIITHEDGTEGIYMDEVVFTSCRTAHEYQVDVLSRRLSFLRPQVSKMQNTLTHMTV